MSESERAGARARAREREWERERELRVLLYKHLYCRVLELSRALSLSVIDHLCVLLQTAWGVRPSCRAAHHARVRLPRRRGFPAARVRVHCRSLHQGAAPRSDFTASCARSHARTLARTHAHTHARTHASRRLGPRTSRRLGRNAFITGMHAEHTNSSLQVRVSTARSRAMFVHRSSSLRGRE